MLQITISNNIRIRGASTPLSAAITKALTMDNPEYNDRLKKRKPTWGIDKKLKLYTYDQGALVAPRGFKKELVKILEDLRIDKNVIAEPYTEGQPVDFGPWNEEYKPYSDQVPAIRAAVENDGVLIAPAGSGKTLMGMNYIYLKARPTLWLTHTKDLLYQSLMNAEKFLLGVGTVGVLGDGKQEWGSGKLIVATIQTLEANPSLIDTLNPIIGTLIVDEAHHLPAASFIEVISRFKAKNVLGLTATPDRKDQLERYMYAGLGPECYRIDRSGLYKAGRLIKPSVQFVYTDFKYTPGSQRNEIDSVDAGGEEMDYRELLNAAIYDEKRAKLIAENILETAANNYSIAIGESVRYAYILRDLVEKFARARFGVVPRMAVIHGPIKRYTWRAAKNEKDAIRKVAAGEALEYKKAAKGRYQVKVEQYTAAEYEAWQLSNARRKEILAAATNKEIDILFTTQLAREGLDMPHLTIGHMVMPKRGDTRGTESGAALEQEIGRIMRAERGNPNKKATWYDYVDYNVGVFKDQYYSRRKVYTRLGIKLPRKKKTETEEIAQFLSDMPW